MSSVVIRVVHLSLTSSSSPNRTARYTTFQVTQTLLLSQPTITEHLDHQIDVTSITFRTMSAPAITLTTPTSAHPTILHSSPTGTLHLVQSTVSGASTIPITRTISGVLIDDSLSSYTFQASSFASDLVSILSAANSAHRPSGTFTLTPSTLPTYSPASYRTNAGSASSSGAGTGTVTATTSAPVSTVVGSTAEATVSTSAGGAASATPAPVATTASENGVAGIAPVVVFVLVAVVVASVALVL